MDRLFTLKKMGRELLFLFVLMCLSNFASAQLSQSKRLLDQGYTPDNNYLLKYETKVRNTGNEAICGVTVEDDITSNYSTCNVIGTDVVNVYGSGGLSVWHQNAFLWDGGVDWDGNGAHTDFSLASNPDSTCVADCGVPICLSPGQEVVIYFVVKLDDTCLPAAGSSLTVNNSATSSGTGAGGSSYSDVSQNGSSASAAGSDPTPANIGVTEATIGAAQMITDPAGSWVEDPIVNPDGTYDFTVNVTICNYAIDGGSGTLYDLAYWDSFDRYTNTLGMTVNNFSLTNPYGPLIVNPDYDGMWGSEANFMDDNGGDLLAGQCDTIHLTMNMGPIPEGNEDNFVYWSAGASGWDGSETINDTSHDDQGANPYNPDPNAADCLGATDNCRASRIKFNVNPSIDLSKEFVSIDEPDSGTLGNVNVTWKMVVSNTGDVNLDNLSLMDSIINDWGSLCVVDVVSDSTKVVNIDATMPPVANTGYTGASSGPGGAGDLLLGSDSDLLGLNESFEVYFTVEVDVNNCDDPLVNAAEVFGDAPNDVEVTAPANAQADLPAMGSIGDTILDDDSGDGILGVMVVLYDDMGNPLDTAYTDSDGLYLFDDIPEGEYVVQVDSSNYDTGSPLEDYYQTTDPDASMDDQSSVSLAEGEDNLDQDFGYTPTGSIGDTILNDDSGNGIEGIMVVLYDDLGNPLDTAYTDVDGLYLFDDLIAGDYTVTVDPTNFDIGGPLEGLDNTTDPDGGFDNTSDVNLGVGEDNLDQDFGYSELGSIGDEIFSDDTGDPIEGVMVVLYDDLGNPMDTAYTDVDGLYLFDDLPAGEYTVIVDRSNFDPGEILEGFINTTDPDGGFDNTSVVTLDPGEDDLDQDFGYHDTELPVELSAFLGEAVDCGNRISWITQTEVNNDYFLLEHSNNGRDFSNLVQIEGAGNSTEVNNYNFTDESPIAHLSYYRLRQVDYDGSFKFSEVIQVLNDCIKVELGNIDVYPNPTKEVIGIKFSNAIDQDAIVQIFNVHGQVILSQPVHLAVGDNQHSFNIENLAEGLYFLQLRGNYFDTQAKSFLISR